MDQMLAEGRVLFGPDERTAPRRKMYLDEQDEQAVRSLVIQERAGATSALIDLMGTDVFDNPKDIAVLGKWINAVTQSKRDALIVDFFGGSGSTGHAVMELNANDGGHRQFILVQIDEAVAEDSNAALSGYGTIADIAKERLRRAGQRFASNTRTNRDSIQRGFRVLGIDTTNLADVLHSPDEAEQLALSALEDSIKPDRTGEDLLFQVLLDWGLELSLPISVEQIDGREVHDVDDGALIACFAETISPELIREIAARQPLRAVFRDSAFASDSDRINADQVFAEVSPSTDVKTI